MYIYVFTPIVQLSIINTISTLYLLLISCIWLVSTYSISPPLYPATLCDASKLNATPIRCTCFSCDAHCTVVQFFDILLTSRSLLQYFTNRTLHVMERLANLTKWTLCSGIYDIHTVAQYQFRRKSIWITFSKLNSHASLRIVQFIYSSIRM